MNKNLYNPIKEQKVSFALLTLKHRNLSSSSVFATNFDEIRAKDMKTVFFESEKMVVSSPF